MAQRNQDKEEEEEEEPEKRYEVCGTEEHIKGIEGEVQVNTKEDDDQEDGLIEGAREVQKLGREESRNMRKLIYPRKPRAEEMVEHEFIHISYGNWFAICVKARGGDLDHRRDTQEDR